MTVTIDNLINNCNQSTTVSLNDGSSVTFNFRLIATMSPAFWVMDVAYNTFTVYNITLCTGVNVLRQWKNVLPFGLSVISNDGLDPCFVDDFTSGRITLFVLDSIDILNAEAYIQGYSQ